MKIPKNLLITVLLFVASYVIAQDLSESKSPEMTFKDMVDGKNFVFNAQSCFPMKGGLRQLSPGYTITVLPDTVISDLPYFGRAQMATINSSDAGIRFTSADFQYAVKNKKKGGWEITLKPKDVQTYPQIYFSVSTNGNTTVRVSSSDRDPITFNGSIAKVEKR